MNALRLAPWLLNVLLVSGVQAVDTAASRPDILVVGAGISGLCAALEAARSGAIVTVVEMGSVFGGHAVMSSGMVCMVGTPEQQSSHVDDSAELAASDFLRFGEDANPEWVRFFAQNSRREVYDWLREIGITGWELYPQIIPGNTVRRQHVAKGRGIGLVSPIYRECLRYSNLSFRWNTKVTGLLIESSRVTGARVIHQRNGQAGELHAQQVILATGGFESNLELVRAYWPRYFPALGTGTRILLGSGINATGSGLDIATNAGARLVMLDHQLFYSTGLVNPRDPSGKRGLHAFNRDAIWVNAQGKRFVTDGQPDPKMQMPAVLDQTPASYWSIFDAASRPQFFVSGSDWNDTNVVQREIFANPKLAQWVKQEDSIDALARACALPVETLRQTIAHWNEMIDHGEDLEFHRFNSSSAERPPKIQTPPYFAVRLFPLARKSLGGVAVDLSCRVLDQRGGPIPGLYAVGELTGAGGINGRAALEGTMLGPGILMGRMAAQESVRKIPRSLKQVSPRPQSVASAQSRSTDVDTLRSWREVLRQIIATPRAGYFHFEKAHAVVLTENLDCVKCHVEPSPLAVHEDQLNRESLTRACPVCHGGVRE